MTKSDSTEVNRKQKRNLNLCTKVTFGCTLFLALYGSLYFVLCSIEKPQDENLASGSKPDFKSDPDIPPEFKDMEGVQGARWIRGEEALKIIENI